MRIKKFETNGFGCLKGSYRFGSQPSTLIIEKNENGKSTLVAGILAALYGLEGNGLQTLPEKERFRPLRSKGFDVTLSIQVGKREYRIKRDFNTETVSVWDEKTGQEVTTEFKGEDGEVRIGEALHPWGRRRRCLYATDLRIESNNQELMNPLRAARGIIC